MSKRKITWEGFGVRIGPFGIDITSPAQIITQTQTETSHVLRIGPTGGKLRSHPLVSNCLLEKEL
jgi:hypothetical protein